MQDAEIQAMPDDSRLPTLEEFKTAILTARRSARAAAAIAHADGNSRAAGSWRAMVRKYDRLVAKYGIEEPPSGIAEPTLEDWRRLLDMPARP